MQHFLSILTALIYHIAFLPFRINVLIFYCTTRSDEYFEVIVQSPNLLNNVRSTKARLLCVISLVNLANN